MAQQRNDQREQHESIAGASEETTQTEESCEMTDGSRWTWIDQSSDLNAAVEASEEVSEESQVPASRRPAKRSQASHERLRYAPSGEQPVDVWFEGTERRTSRDFTESEEELFRTVKTEEVGQGVIRFFGMFLQLLCDEPCDFSSSVFLALYRA